MTRARLTFLVIAYTLVTAVMAGPLINYSALRSATYQGDARHSLAYNEHLFGLSRFTLPLYALTRNPVLAYNIVCSWTGSGPTTCSGSDPHQATVDQSLSRRLKPLACSLRG